MMNLVNRNRNITMRGRIMRLSIVKNISYPLQQQKVVKIAPKSVLMKADNKIKDTTISKGLKDLE